MNKTFLGIVFFLFVFGCQNSGDDIVSFTDLTVKAFDLDTGNPIADATVAVVHYYENVEHKIVRTTSSAGVAYFTDVYVVRCVHIFVVKSTPTEKYIYEGENISLKLTGSQDFTVRIKNQAFAGDSCVKRRG